MTEWPEPFLTAMSDAELARRLAECAAGEESPILAERKYWRQQFARAIAEQARRAHERNRRRA